MSSSFRFHRPRGAICGRGYCFQCDGDCAAAAGRRRDPLRPLGRLAERRPPWFYERFPRGRLALGALRRLSAARPLAEPAAPVVPRRFEESEAETVVVTDALNVLG